jgi:hypothetical protein
VASRPSIDGNGVFTRPSELATFFGRDRWISPWRILVLECGMGQTGVIIFSLILAALLILLASQRRLVDALIEAINNFRGGPPTVMHPSPSDDTALLRKPARKTQDQPLRG